MNILKSLEIKKVRQKGLIENKKLAIGVSIVVFCIITALMISFIMSVSTTSIANIQLFPGGDRSVGWSYYDASGNTGHEQLNEFGYLDRISGIDSLTVAAERIMTENLPNAYLYFQYYNQLISVYLDGKLLYSDIFETPKDKIVFLAPEASAFDDQLKTTYVSLPSGYTGKKLTIITYNMPDIAEANSAFPSFPELCNDSTFSAISITSTAKDFVVCGMFALTTIVLLIMIIYGEVTGDAQWYSLLLAIYFFSMTVKCGYESIAASYNIGVNLLGYLFSDCSSMFLLLFCACYMRKRFRIVLNCATLLHRTAVIALTVHNARSGFFYKTNNNGILEFGLLMLFVIFCILEWNSKKQFFSTLGKSLLVLSGCYIGSMVGFYVLMPETDFGLQLYMPFSSLVVGHPVAFNGLLSDGLAISGMMAVLQRFLQANAAQRTEQRMLALKNEIMVSNFHNMEVSMQKTEEQRHELKHHIAALQILLHDRQIEKAETYLKNIDQAVNSSMAKHYTSNLLINAVLNDFAAKTKDQAVRFEAEAVVAPELCINDNDLCSLLYNMLDNALYACSRIMEGERWIQVKLKLKGKFLTIVCSNSKVGEIIEDEKGNIITTHLDSLNHGYGMAVMRKICESYHSILLVEYTEDNFTVRTNLRLPDAC